VNYSIAANTLSSPRTGTLTVAGQTVTVTQDAACTYTVAPTTQIIPAAGGTGNIAITTASGCSWTATTSAGWISIAAGSAGSGSGTVAYTVAATATPPRTGTLTVAGQTVTVTQASVPTAPTGLRVVR